MSELANITPADQQIYHLRRAGHSFDDICLLTGLDRTQALKMYTGYMKKLTSEFSLEERDMHKQMELDRLDELQAGIWDEASRGDVRKIETVLKIIGMRVKLLGFDQVTPTPDNIRNVILVNGNSEDFINALRQGREQHVVTSTVVEDETEEDTL